VLVEYSKEMKAQLRGPSDAVRVYNQLVGINTEGDVLCELETFIGISDVKRFCTVGKYKFSELANPYKDEIISKVKSIKFLIGLLPEASNREFNFQRRWLRDVPRLNSTVSGLIDEQTSYLKRNYDAFRTDFQSTLSQSLSGYYRRAIEAANNTANVESIQSAVNGLWIIQKESVDLLVVQMNGTFLDHVKVNSILSEKSVYDPFVIQMKWEGLLKGLDLLEKVKDLELEIQKYLVRFEIFVDNAKLISKEYFSSMSSIMDKINKDEAIRNFESIQIFATNSFTFDVDFVIDINKYFTNAPRLIVVAPKVFVTKQIKVDLSCRRIPEKAGKAQNGDRWSLDGKDGKSGLPGYNGGSFLVYADYLEGGSYLNVISGEGKGGAGQDG
jgi:hypothetical protein